MRWSEIRSPLDEMRIWGAQSHGYSFLIMLEEMQPPDPKWNGYTASWKDLSKDLKPVLAGFGGTQPANRIDGGPWKTFTEAASACEAKRRELTRRG